MQRRRRTDEIEQRIKRWELTRADFGPEAAHAIDDYIEDEIQRLQQEQRLHDVPLPGGRRATDPRTSTQE